MIDPIDDYIDPQLIIQARAHEIEQLTRKCDYASAFEANGELMTASQNLDQWLWQNMSDAEKKRIID